MTRRRIAWLLVVHDLPQFPSVPGSMNRNPAWICEPGHADQRASQKVDIRDSKVIIELVKTNAVCHSA